MPNSILKKTSFIWLFLAFLASGAGNAIVPIAFAIEATRIEPSGWGLTSILVMLWFGRFIGASFYRKIDPNHNPALIMIVSDFFKLLAQLGLLVFIYLYENNIIAMTASALIYGVASAYFAPSSFIILPRLVPKSNLQTANSWLSLSTDWYGVLGPLLGSSIVIWLGFKAVLWVDIITFLISLFCLIILYRNFDNRKIDENHIQDSVASLGKLDGLPEWTKYGMVSWFFCSLLIGFFGVAGPNIVINNYSEFTWALFLTVMALGAISGSFVSLKINISYIRWSYLHFVFAIALAIQLMSLSLSLSIITLFIVSFIASCLNITSGIYWDSLNQTNLLEKQLQSLASLDLLVHTIAIPLGMLLFGAATWLNLDAFISMALSIVLVVFSIPILVKKSPKYTGFSN